MIISNKEKRKIQKYYVFGVSCLVSLIGLAFYWIGRNIPFPSWVRNQENKLISFGNLFLGTSLHSNINFFLEIFFSFFESSSSEDKIDTIKTRKWKHWISKTLILFFSFLSPCLKQPNLLLREDWKDIVLLGLVSVVTNYCLLEMIIQLMNQYGICNAFNLMFFFELLPIVKLEVKGGKWPLWSFLLYLFSWFAITVLFIWITNLNWEIPVETNNLYNQNNDLVKKTRFHLGFKLNFEFSSFYFLSWIISQIYYIKKKSPNDNDFWEIFFNLNEKGRIFWTGAIGATILLILLRYLFSWLAISRGRLRPSEVSKDLREKGIYIDGLPSGNPTKKLLKKVINKMIFFWFFVITVFNLVFELLIADHLINLSFINWFISVNVGVSLIQQIITKYRYIQANK